MWQHEGAFMCFICLCCFLKERPQEVALQFAVCAITKVHRLSEFGALNWFDQLDFVIPCLVCRPPDSVIDH